MPEARLARPSDLDGVITLFQASEVSAVVGPRERAAHVVGIQIRCTEQL
jgi:hypothetical protein